MKTRIMLLASVLAFAGPACADELLINKVRAGAEHPVPARGLSQTQVQDRFGEPDNRMPAVGDPPISRWVYPDFTVYFEHQYVIDSVVHPHEADTQDDTA